MTNAELVKDVGILDRGSYSLYLRGESLKKVIDSKYTPDKSFSAYERSKFYKTRYVNYSDYLESLDDNISFSEYICESVDKSITYTDYIAAQCMNTISYSEYLAEKTN